MRIILKQTNKERFSADFSIVDLLKKAEIGYVHFESGKGVNNFSGNHKINFLNNEISLKFFNESAIENYIKNAYRPCEICIGEEKRGYICQRAKKTGFFTSYTYDEMVFDMQKNNMYPIDLGKLGSVNTIWDDTLQLAQVEKDNVVYNELHEFNIFSIDEKSALISLMFCCYIYTITFFKSGIKVKKSVERYYSGKTKNKELLSKYNPNFKSENFII